MQAQSDARVLLKGGRYPESCERVSPQRPDLLFRISCAAIPPAQQFCTLSERRLHADGWVFDLLPRHGCVARVHVRHAPLVASSADRPDLRASLRKHIGFRFLQLAIDGLEVQPANEASSDVVPRVLSSLV